MSKSLLLLLPGLFVPAVAQARGDPPNSWTVYEPTGRPVGTAAAGPRLPKAELAATDLLSLSRAELEKLYADSEAGPIPDGEAAGRATLDPGGDAERSAEQLIAIFWKGKIFKRLDAEHGELVNRILGHKLVKAKVYYGDSFRDTKRSIIIDYSETSVIAAALRDEIRLVSPGLYLGFAYIRGRHGALHGQPLIFALQFPK
jgi:hypothetical protein